MYVSVELRSIYKPTDLNLASL